MGFPKVPQLPAWLLALAHFQVLLLWASQLFLFPGALRRAGPTDPADTQRTTCAVQNKRLSFHQYGLTLRVLTLWVHPLPVNIPAVSLWTVKRRLMLQHATIHIFIP